MCISWYKKAKIAEIGSKQNNWFERGVIYPLWNGIISYNITDGWILTSSLDIKKVFFDIPKLLWDDISICNITDGWILTSSLDIQMCFLVFLDLTKLSPDQKMVQIWYHRVPTVFIIIPNSKNKLIWLVMSSMLYFFPFRTLEKLDLEILDFWLFT